MLSFLQHKQQEMTETLRALVQHESPSREKALVDLCGQELRRQFAALVGGEAETIPMEQAGDCYRFTYGAGEEQILILGHFDTVWPQGALPIREENGVMYGPGTFDMKGGLTITLWALHALREHECLGRRRIVFLATSDEEIGSAATKDLIQAEARKSVCVLVPESSISPDGAVKTARKGLGLFDMHITGVPVHAGINPQDGASAIEELAAQILDLKKLNRYAEGISVNVGVVSGGTGRNVVAKEARAQIDLRFGKAEQAEALEQAIRERPSFVPGTTVTVTGRIDRYPLERTEATVRLYTAFREIAALHGYDLGEGLSGGVSDGNFTAALGIPTIDGLGPIGDGAHAENEHVVLSNLPVRAALLAEFLRRNL